MDPTVAKLQKFIERFRRRPDIRTTTLIFGEPALTEAIEKVRGTIPDELEAFYASMNGVHFEWSFVEPPGAGCIRIPPLNEWTRFASDEEIGTAFGPSRRAFLLDEIQPECATWYLREQSLAPNDAILWFTRTASTHDGKLIARTLAEYIDLAIEHAFVAWWPVAGFPDAIARARAKPVKPSRLAVGTRVQTDHYSEGARGVIDEIREITLREGSVLAASGTTYARVSLDEGLTAWMPLQILKAVKKRDDYEEAVLRGEAFWDELCTRPIPDRLASMARAIGPINGYSPTWAGPSNARRAAGLLAPLDVATAVRVLVSAFDDAGRISRGGIALLEPRALEKTGGEFDPSEWRPRKFEFIPGDILEGLVAGFARKVVRESVKRQVAPIALIPEDAPQRLRNLRGFATYAKDAITAVEVAASPDAGRDDEKIRDELGLPGPWPARTGTGF